MPLPCAKQCETRVPTVAGRGWGSGLWISEGRVRKTDSVPLKKDLLSSCCASDTALRTEGTAEIQSRPSCPRRACDLVPGILQAGSNGGRLSGAPNRDGFRGHVRAQGTGDVRMGIAVGSGTGCACLAPPGRSPGDTDQTCPRYFFCALSMGMNHLGHREKI